LFRLMLLRLFLSDFMTIFTAATRRHTIDF
jgi:hypothetical protein